MIINFVLIFDFQKKKKKKKKKKKIENTNKFYLLSLIFTRIALGHLIEFFLKKLLGRCIVGLQASLKELSQITFNDEEGKRLREFNDESIEEIEVELGECVKPGVIVIDVVEVP